MNTTNYTTSPKNLGELLQEWRREIGFTRPSAAQALAVPLPTFNGWIAGKPCGKEKMVRLLMQSIIDEHRR